MPLRDLPVLLEATPAGLISAEAKQRLRLHGPNSLVAAPRFTTLMRSSAKSQLRRLRTGCPDAYGQPIPLASTICPDRSGSRRLRRRLLDCPRSFS